MFVLIQRNKAYELFPTLPVLHPKLLEKIVDYAGVVSVGDDWDGSTFSTPIVPPHGVPTEVKKTKLMKAFRDDGTLTSLRGAVKSASSTVAMDFEWEGGYSTARQCYDRTYQKCTKPDERSDG